MNGDDVDRSPRDVRWKTPAVYAGIFSETEWTRQVRHAGEAIIGMLFEKIVARSIPIKNGKLCNITIMFMTVF